MRASTGDALLALGAELPAPCEADIERVGDCVKELGPLAVAALRDQYVADHGFHERATSDAIRLRQELAHRYHEDLVRAALQEVLEDAVNYQGDDVGVMEAIEREVETLERYLGLAELATADTTRRAEDEYRACLAAQAVLVLQRWLQPPRIQAIDNY